jgi:regulator of RNase E activity RraA
MTDAATAAARLRELGSSVVADALRDLGHRRQTAAHGLRPVVPEHACAGPARTARFERVPEASADFLPLAELIDSCRPGEVLVLDSARDASPGSVWGEICSTAAIGRDAAGVVIDGFMRDELRLGALGLPLFSRGAFPQDCLGRSMVRATNVAVEIGGVSVQPGDLVVADVDGVVFVPAAMLDEVLAASEEKHAAEQALLEAVRDGGSLRDAVARIGTL